MSKDKTGSIEASNSACPHCGRRDAAPPYPVPPLPWYGQPPWVYPYRQPPYYVGDFPSYTTVTCNTTTAIDGRTITNAVAHHAHKRAGSYC